MTRPRLILTAEQKEEILNYYFTDRLSVPKIIIKTGFSRAVVFLVIKESSLEIVRVRSKSRKEREVQKDEVIHGGHTRHRPKAVSNPIRDYDFLKYARVVYRWALKNHPALNRPRLDLLLTLYATSAFSRKEFILYHRTIGLCQSRTLSYLIERGYLRIWKVRSYRKGELFCLTKKAKDLCALMHQYCVGDKKIPLDKRNVLTTDNSLYINRYYVAVIKEMNDREKLK